MEKEIEKLEEASKARRKPSPFSDDFLNNVKASDDFLVPLFMNFVESMGWPESMVLWKSNFYKLVKYIPLEEIDKKVIEVLDTIAEIAQVNSPCQKERTEIKRLKRCLSRSSMLKEKANRS